MRTLVAGVRLPSEVWARYSAAAQELGLTLSAYLRQRLDERDHLADELAALRAALERAATSASGSGTPAYAGGVLVELLYMVRQIAGPQKAAIAHSEVERRGLKSW
jgi:hypothetical protein